MYPLLRSWLFQFDPERVHGLTLKLVRLAGSFAPLRLLLRNLFKADSKPVHAFGLEFNNPVGLAAGYDKDGVGWRGLACLGFGHIEIGTVTLRPQPGNSRPRLFRLTQDKALINRMGFSGKGADFVARQIQGGRPYGVILGVNLGKNKDTPLEAAQQDYALLLQRFYPLADYLAINVSSPNTAGLRRLQARQSLHELLNYLDVQRQELQEKYQRRVPVLVKLAPDLSDEELEDAVRVILDTGMDGVIATNTTLSREGLSSPQAGEAGGLSGGPLKGRSTQMIRQIVQTTSGKLPVIGVGGIMNPDDAKEKMDAGAVLIQVYTGLVYSGPGLVRKIISEL